MRFFWALSLIFLLSGTLSLADCRNLSVPMQEGVAQQCHHVVSSDALGGEVYIKAWVPLKIQPQTPVILFFHGRGYSHGPESNQKSMIEAVGLYDWIQSESYRANPAIILSPQDLFVREDGTSKGNDYWLGADGRDWERFVVHELIPGVREQFKVSGPWLAAGISMGAHGAMKMALDFPNEFKAFASLSPVFRSSQAEIKGSDQNVFYKTGSLTDTSMGARFLETKSIWQSLRSMPHWIEIHESDFALGPGFEDSRKVWSELLKEPSDDGRHRVLINTESIKMSGHSAEYWSLRLPEILTWLVNQ